ncbi:hypothetical protein LOK49_LG03G02235 [Camellia lanceoleosa]|uniref:Uncharacterized protein n=1 Tax=Camellia lanceoleosa TaxID=1840588 RepID=A0ACC0I7M7_9ERIC|nr:hypothetical protein LOK49_LG03G02235 [Camellia lanceoleosa]
MVNVPRTKSNVVLRTIPSLSQASAIPKPSSNPTIGVISEDPKSIKKVPTSRLPMICLREGGPPLPDAYNTSLISLVLDPIANGSFGDIQGLQNEELCYLMQKNISVTLTNEQISPGVWYWGLFNGIGPTRTQSKMTVLRKNPSVPFESYYLPISTRASSKSANFPLEPLLSNSSSNSSNDGKLDFVWTYFLLDVPYGASGGNLHVQLKSDAKINYEIYAKYGGLPSLDSWDYFYANMTSFSNGSMFFKLYDSGDETVSFYIFYVRGGTWSFGLRHLNPSDNTTKNQTTLSISLERCPMKCSSHGTCPSVLDTSGLTLYSYCSCDRDHGGFDCSVEIVSPQGHLWQSISLIASNAAAVLPAFWCLRQKAFAEWVLFMSSGIASGLYHACDVGTWCPLSFHVLQFLDFWLSFMAVVSTFVYLADIGDASKRTIHTVVAIVTALMAETGPTRSTNIVLVIAIGAFGLLIGWLIEFCTKYRSRLSSTVFCLNIVNRWQTVKVWLHNLMKTILKRFSWGYVLAAFTALAMAAISWTLESSESYWVWHSIYTSSFLFLCSKAITVDSENQNQRPPDGNYELTRRDSFSRGETE